MQLTHACRETKMANPAAQLRVLAAEAYVMQTDIPAAVFKKAQTMVQRFLTRLRGPDSRGGRSRLDPIQHNGDVRQMTLHLFTQRRNRLRDQLPRLW